MLSEIFYWVLNISIVGSGCGLILLALRKTNRLPKFAVYVLWVIPFIRFWIPFGITNEYSVLNFISRFSTKTVAISSKFTMTNFVISANDYFPIEYKTKTLENIFTISSFVWIIVAWGMIISSFLLYYFTKSELKNLTHIKDNIYKSDKISSPAVYGIWKAKIIISTNIVEGDIDYIIMHEHIHIQRRDNLWRMVAVITACMHWFNPLTWVFLKRFFADMELACDNSVLKNLEKSKVKEYAAAVLNVAQGKSFFASAFGGAKTKVRIENILSYKKLTLASAFISGVLIITIAIVLLTNAVN